MFATIVGDHVYVRLSRRNLRQLDDLLDGQDARRRCLVRKDENGMSLVVQVEEDADHYDERDPALALGEIAHQPQDAIHS